MNPYAKASGSVFGQKTKAPASTGAATATASTSASSSAAQVGAPVRRTDEELAPLVAKGIPRGAVINLSKEGMAALKELETNKGDPTSPAYQTLKAETGNRADLMRAVFAQGGPHAKAGDDQKVTLAASLNEGFKADAKHVEEYKKPLERMSEDGTLKPYVKMAADNRADNLKQYPEDCKQSVENIQKLPEEHQVALYKYTQEKYRPYNQALFPLSKQTDLTRTDNRTIETNAAGIAVTRTALEGLPKYEGTVYRGDKKMHYDAYQQGAIITRDGFTSTAKDQSGMFNRDCELVIHNKTGRDIQGCSLKPAEKEVLIPPGASFEVLKREERGGKLYLELKEI